MNATPTAIGRKTVPSDATSDQTSTHGPNINASTASTTNSLLLTTDKSNHDAQMHSNGETSNGDISLKQRDATKSSVRTKFEDIVSVSESCESIDHDFSTYTDEIDVAGSLCTESSVKFFEKIGANEYILNSLKNGHHSKLTGKVPPYERNNNKSFFEHEDFALKTLWDLVGKGRIKLATKEQLHIVNPLSVAVQRNKNRLILDCSYLNGFVEAPRFKYEDATDALSYFKKNVFMFTWDLKDGYHQIRVHEDFKKYLGLKFDYKGITYYGYYTVFPFGLCDIPYLFTKIFRVLIRHWRSQAMHVIKFLDDGICFSACEQKAKLASKTVRSDLLQAGAYWSVKKSVWKPVKVCEWLGITWDANLASISAAPHRVKKILATCTDLLSRDSCPVKALASFTGQINSLNLIVGNCCSLTTRCSQQAIAAAPTWLSNIVLTANIHTELKFWLENLISLNSRCCDVQKPPTFLHIIASDASDSGVGSLLDDLNTKAARLLSIEERLKHSTYRELLAVSHALKSFLPQIRHSRVKMLLDNQSAARIIEVGSMKPDIHALAMEIFFTCLHNGISLATQWIPRSLNEAADSASRDALMIDTDDWQLTKPFFSILNVRWGPFTIDCFANDYNAKLDRFFSLFNSPGGAGVDAFSFDWKNELCLLVPPVCMVGKALNHLRLCQGKGVLVVPAWPSAHYWPMLLDDFSSDIKDCLRVKGKNALMHGHNTNSILGSPEFVGDVLALYIDCAI